MDFRKASLGILLLLTLLFVAFFYRFTENGLLTTTGNVAPPHGNGLDINGKPKSIEEREAVGKPPKSEKNETQLLLPLEKVRDMFFTWEAENSEILWAAAKAAGHEGTVLIRVIPGTDSPEWEEFKKAYFAEAARQLGKLHGRVMVEQSKLIQEKLPVKEESRIAMLSASGGKNGMPSLAIFEGATRDNVTIDPKDGTLSVEGGGALLSDWEGSLRDRFEHLFEITEVTSEE
ncbi:MAG: hypothetical protein AAGA58_13075 [Verrucomicrobiota bacterium]